MTDFDVLVIGGGIQGVGVLHDLASRNITNTHLLEERALAIGTSSRSTKLLHGGLRYLERLSQWGLVREALTERGLLLQLLGDVVRPVPFVLPALKGGRPAWMLRLGLRLYDFLAGDCGLPASRGLKPTEIQQLAPYLNPQGASGQINDAFLFYDGQMLDDVIVQIAARAAEVMGASWEEGARVDTIEQVFHENARKPYYRVSGTRKTAGSKQESFTYTARFVVAVTGAWNNANLLRWGFVPTVPCILNVGSHLVFNRSVIPSAPNPDHCAATLLQNDDGRVLFFIPWFGRWLYGTTESALRADPRGLVPPAGDRDYLMRAAHLHLDLNDPALNTEEFFAGVRTMPVAAHRSRLPQPPPSSQDIENPFASNWYLESTPANLSRLSRESVLSETAPNLLTIYGGKYTTYRAQAEQIGKFIKDRLGKGSASQTARAEAWHLDRIKAEHPEIFTSSPSLRRA